MNRRECEVCHHDVPEGSTRRYCSWECTQAARKARARHRAENARTLSPPVVGAVAELVAAADLLRRGFPVYRAVSPAAPCDLIVLVAPERPLRVEVRTGRRSSAGAVVWNQSGFRADLYAVVVFGESGGAEVLYRPGLESFAPGPVDPSDTIPTEDKRGGADALAIQAQPARNPPGSTQSGNGRNVNGGAGLGATVHRLSTRKRPL